MTLQLLISKLSEAGGGSRDLDYMLAEMFTLTAMPYTYSIDAALSLVEQKLPGWEWLVRSSPSYACVWQAKGVGDLSAEATLARPATPTLALLVALLRALEASPPSPQGPQ